MDINNSPLLIAAAEGKRATVFTLLASGADVNETNFYGCTALMQAARKGYLEVVKVLLQYKASCNAVNDMGEYMRYPVL